MCGGRRKSVGLTILLLLQLPVSAAAAALFQDLWKSRHFLESTTPLTGQANQVCRSCDLLPVVQH